MKKILMVATQEMVNDLSDGGKRVTNRNWNLLCDVFGKENVYLVMMTNSENIDDKKQIIRYQSYSGIFNRVINIIAGRIFYTRKAEENVLNIIETNDINIVFLDRTVFGGLASSIRHKYENVLIWTFAHNLEVDYFKNKLKKIPILNNVICSQIYKSEKNNVQLANRLFCLTERDKKLFLSKYGVDSEVIPTSFPDLYNESLDVKHNKDSITSLLFIGSMFGPNYDGIKWFVDNVMPDLENFSLMIVGKNFETKKNELERENVTVIGTVDDLEEYYYTDSIMVMPIFYGDGQKVKTAEAMMYGKVIFATDEALEGYETEGVRGIICCNTKEEFIRNIRAFQGKDYDVYAASVRKVFKQYYSYDGVLERFLPILSHFAEDV